MSARTVRRYMHRIAAVLLAAVVAVITTVVSAGPASAHSGNQSYLYLDVTDKALTGRIEAPIRDINTVLGTAIEGSDDEVSAALTVRLPALADYFGKHLKIGAAGATWPVRFLEATRFFSGLPEQDGNYAIVTFVADVGDQAVPRQLDLTFDPFFDEIEGRDALLLIGNDWQGGVIENSHTINSTFGAGNRNQVIDLGDTGWFKNFKSSGRLGVHHIRTGPDHILFVLVLLLPSVLVFASGRWQPTRSFGASLWRVLKVVTMFTLAHSITFTLAGLGILPSPSSRIVESIIAISIAVAALHNLRPIFPNREWAISFVFGLFHGLGFASLVENLDVPRSTQLISLLGRNAGIEVGQSIVVLLIFPALFLLRRTRYFKPVFVGASILFTIISIGWMIERVFIVDLSMGRWVDPVTKMPRALLPIAVLTVIAAILNRLEHRKQRLAPVTGVVELRTTEDALTSV